MVYGNIPLLASLGQKPLLVRTNPQPHPLDKFHHSTLNYGIMVTQIRQLSTDIDDAEAQEDASHLQASEQTSQAQLNNLCPSAIKIISHHIRGRRRKLPPSLQRACEYVIDHAIGKAKVKVEHSGGIMTYAELTRSVEQLEKAPPRLLIQVNVNGQIGGAANGTATTTTITATNPSVESPRPSLPPGQVPDAPAT